MDYSWVNDMYIQQKALIGKHKKATEWLSTIVVWKREIIFFQKILSDIAAKPHNQENKNKIDYFKQVADEKATQLKNLVARLRSDEKRLAEMVEARKDPGDDYLHAHDALMNELEVLDKHLHSYKEVLFKDIYIPSMSV